MQGPLSPIATAVRCVQNHAELEFDGTLRIVEFDFGEKRGDRVFEEGTRRDGSGWEGEQSGSIIDWTRTWLVVPLVGFETRAKSWKKAWVVGAQGLEPRTPSV